MATIVLSAVGMAAGASIGGSVLGLSSAIIGRAVGATLGRVLDQSLMGAGSDVVETGKVDRFRLTGASEGAPVAQVYGQMRVAGQVIWATRFKESVSTSGGGGKGAPKKPKTTSYSYSISLAIALCEGEITRVGRIWADGVEIARDDLNLRVYKGERDQMPDPQIEAVEGSGNAPAYRGLAYVVLEDVELGQFGNRIPQFSFEVLRPSQPDQLTELARGVQAVALIPGTGEYALATTPVHFEEGPGISRSANISTPSGKTDFATSVEALNEELPNCGSVSLVVSWFGDDLRCGNCSIQPKVEQKLFDGTPVPWSVGGLSRSAAAEVPQLDGRPVYGGTPADQSVFEALVHLGAAGKDVVYYPFILMDQLAGNGLPDPWSDATDQPTLPWRGRITLSKAPGQAGSPDGTTAAEAEVAAFFGNAAASDFTINGNSVSYGGPAEWSYRRFILHQAHLCKAAGGVTAFCIGSELRGMTRVRGTANSFPAVAALRQLAADVRQVLGAATKIGYAADWSEYFGYHPQDGSGDVFFNLDPLWADSNIDFVGIDNYMPLSDWREGTDHADAHWGSIYDLAYLKSNILGGEGYDWFYHSPEAAAAQIRTPITDDAHAEPWVFRYKDVKSWWSKAHHERLAGVRQASPTAWVPGSKPIWFTEMGCPAVDKGTNQPNKFIDPKSSESGLPYYSDGTRDELIQMQYLRAMFAFWADSDNNPTDPDSGVRMVDMGRAHVWAWDARPFPFFPNDQARWSDGEAYARGHWLTGRTGARSLASVVEEICTRSGVTAYDTRQLHGYVRGYMLRDTQGARAALQPLLLAYGFDVVERNGQLVFRNRSGLNGSAVELPSLAVLPDQDGLLERTRAPEAETAGKVRLNYVEAAGDYEARVAEAVFPDEAARSIAQTELPLALTVAEGRKIVERWLAESRVSRDGARFALPLSRLALGAGDIVRIPGDAAGEADELYRIDHLEQSGAQLIEAVRIEPGVYQPSDDVAEVAPVRPFTPAVPVYPLFLDLPLLGGSEIAHAPHVAVTATPWPGTVALYSAVSDSGYTLNRLIGAAATIGVTQSPLAAAKPGLRDRGAPLRVKIFGGTLSSVPWDAVLNGANLAAIGDGTAANWEVFQFADAELVGEDTYDLSNRLRGQAGTDYAAPSDWPAGSRIVLLNGVPEQIELQLSARGLARHYRIGPAARNYDDPSYIHKVEAFDGIGLRPYSPCHLRAERDASGDLQLSWIRRTRVDGDSWASVEVPLGEDSEAYLLRVISGSAILREVTVASPNWTYLQSMQTADGATVPYSIDVAQISQSFGPGPFRRITIND